MVATRLPCRCACGREDIAMVDGRLISFRDTNVLFLRRIAKIVYRKSKKNVRQNPIAPKLLTWLPRSLVNFEQQRE